MSEKVGVAMGQGARSSQGGPDGDVKNSLDLGHFVGPEGAFGGGRPKSGGGKTPLPPPIIAPMMSPV